MANLLLDTQVLLWFLADEPRLKPAARELVSDPLNDVFVSAASAWEITIKASLGKLAVPPRIVQWLPAELAANRLSALPITVAHAAGVEQLPAHHADPFDRLLIAQARAENLTVVTSDAQFEPYEVGLIRF
jgi:PIN domain nuclease of toxin-antitoxin system